MNRQSKNKTKKPDTHKQKQNKKNLTVNSVSKNTKHPGLSNTAEGNAMWFYHFAKMFGGFL